MTGVWTYQAGSIRGTWNPRVSSPRFLATIQDDGNVTRCYSTGRPRLQRRRRTGIWQLLPKTRTEHSIQTCLVSCLLLPVPQFQGRPCTDIRHIGLYARRPVGRATYRNSLSPAIYLE
ncbi:uncharacterized protein TNCV_1004101 [Trichonephila clavipes]|nr:uncharacterized protein TNCV_1004101 [Trichonephila clavipes]